MFSVTTEENGGNYDLPYLKRLYIMHMCERLSNFSETL